MVVKVQIDISGKQVLAYNKDRSIFYLGEAPEDLKKDIGPRRKAFYKAHIDDKGIMQLDKFTRDRKW